MKLLRNIFFIGLTLFIVENGYSQMGAGYPQWPLILRHSNNGLTNTVNNQLLDFSPSFLVDPVSSPTSAVVTGQTSADYGPSAAAYDNCGNIAFYLNHTGTFLPTANAGLKIIMPSGTENALTSGGNRMDCSPMDNEIQVFLMPNHIHQWIIIYNRNFDPTTGTFTNAKTRYLQVLYSIVSDTTGSLAYVVKDQNLNNAATTYHDYSKAVSIEYQAIIQGASQKVRYIYLKRSITRTLQDPATASDIYVEQYAINSNGVVLISGNPRVLFYNIAKGFSAVEDYGTPMELNETNGEIKLATMMNYNGTAGNTSSVGSRVFYAKFTDHEQFNSIIPEIIQCADLALIPSDNTGDTYNLSYHTSGWGGVYKAPKNFINGTLTLQTYLSNFHRGLNYIEFSPNGRFLYVAGGGYSVASKACITHFGQIDLSQKVLVGSPLANQYTLRLKVQKVYGQALGANNYKYYGQAKTYTGITDTVYINFKGISVMEKAPNAKVYFTKLNSRVLFCLNDADEVFTNIDFLPLDLLSGYANNITLLNDPTYSTNNTVCTMLPDAIDQNNYTAQLSGCNATVPCANCIGSFAPDPNSTTVYQLSTWVHDANYVSTPTILTFTDPQISIDYISTVGGITTVGPFTASGQIIDGWQRLEAQFTVPTGTANIELKLQCVSGDCNFDDIRIFPFDGSMKTYVYDPVNLRLSAELDERNYATFYEYDEEGKLMRIKKETEKGIMTIQESKMAVKKQ